MKRTLLLIWICLTTIPCPAHVVVREGDSYKVSHEWNYKGRKWTSVMYIPVALYEYYQGRPHISDDMVHFALSDYDRIQIRDLVDSFRDGGASVGFSEKDHLGNVISFVQSLQYVIDQKSKGVEDYVRFPVETLVDGIGDCEDMAILAAAILHEMGYDVMLVNLPDHLALAVDCQQECDGTYYEYQGAKYYYLEVTNTGWEIGQIPHEFRSHKATLIPLVHQPKVRINRCSYQHGAYYSTAREVPFTIRCEMENLGPGTTESLSLHVLFKRRQSDVAALTEQSFALQEMDEGTSGAYEVNLTVPRPFRGIIEIRAEGLNLEANTMILKGIDLR